MTTTKDNETLHLEDRDNVTEHKEAYKVVAGTNADLAVKVIAGYEGDLHWDPEEEKRLIRKIDRKLLVILCLSYGLQYYDKALLSQAVSRLISGDNIHEFSSPSRDCYKDVQFFIANASFSQAIFGLRDDLQLTIGNRYSFSASIFYIGFICGAYPAVFLAQRFPIEYVASGIVGVWGACLMAAAACTNFEGLFAQRFFLGFLESGIPPMFMLIVGGWCEFSKPSTVLLLSSYTS